MIRHSLIGTIHYTINEIPSVTNFINIKFPFRQRKGLFMLEVGNEKRNYEVQPGSMLTFDPQAV